MTRLTKRESALSFLLGAPLDMDVPIPEKKKRDPKAPREWRLQAECVKNIRERQKYDKSLRFIAAGAAQSRLTEKQKGFAKMIGFGSGIPDIILIRLKDSALKFHWVELKLPGKGLSEPQKSWFEFLAAGGVPRDRIDNLKDFLKILDAI